jgi:hypothetical protein
MKMLSEGMFDKPSFSGGLQQDGIAVLFGAKLEAIDALYEELVLVQLNSVEVNTANRINSFMIIFLLVSN